MDQKNQKYRILDVGINHLSVNELLTSIVDTISTGERSIIAYVNSFGILLAHKEARFKRFLNNADIVYCDGFGVRIAAKIMGYPPPARYTLPDWIGDLAQTCIVHDYSMYFLGARPGVAEKTALLLQRRYPGLKICGSHHGYFDRKVDSLENAEIISEINDFSPSLLLVGFGMPAQEYWIEDNWDHLNTGVILPVGAMFDYVSGETPRAPQWMTDHGLEWLGRLVVEPRRLWQRYVIGIPHFLFLVIMDRIKNSRGIGVHHA